MIDKLSAAVTNKGTRKKRQREINRDETRTSRVGSLTRQKSGEQCAHERIAFEANYAGALWVAGSCCLPVNSPRASIGPLCHCQYSKELQIIWWLMVHSRTHWIYRCSAAMRADLNRYNARFLLHSLILRCFLPFRLFRPFGISLSDPRWFLLLLLESSLISSCPFHVTSILSCVSSAAIVPLFFLSCTFLSSAIRTFRSCSYFSLFLSF